MSNTIVLHSSVNSGLEADTTVRNILLVAIVGGKIVTACVTCCSLSTLLLTLLFVCSLHLGILLLQLIAGHGLGRSRFRLFLIQDTMLSI